MCGAPNTAVGLRAAFAPPGARLPGGREIAVAKIRGVESQGMLCSERELGLGDEHEAGVLALDADAPLGADLVEHLGLDDRVLEIEITPNRPDCLSVLGVARELAALTGTPAAPARPSRCARAAESARALARVRVEAPDLCPALHRASRDRRSGWGRARPGWRRGCARCGLRPISNVVDVTNYVLWELGHPLHAFDGDRVTDRTIVVRRAQAGERFTHPRRPGPRAGRLDAGDRRPRSGHRPGRRDGRRQLRGQRRHHARASWSPRTSRRPAIRRTSRTLGLRTDAAYRFERGADIEGLVDAGARAAQLMAELAGGTVARGLVDVYRPRRKPVRVRLRLARVAARARHRAEPAPTPAGS